MSGQEESGAFHFPADDNKRDPRPVSNTNRRPWDGEHAGAPVFRERILSFTPLRPVIRVTDGTRPDRPHKPHRLINPDPRHR